MTMVNIYERSLLKLHCVILKLRINITLMLKEDDRIP